ncbi:TRAP transporter small permease subunit [Ectothiorhodospiraceae bacterium WFHF3C12]|nr:TRAP transporter small permease subunit [Ectothiorhodospiraceae bacterium WFHF3C12]
MRGLIRALSLLVRGIDGLNQVIGRTLAWLTLAMVVVTFTVVVLRYGFNMGWIAMQESVMYMHAFVFMACAGYTLRHNGHVRVDVFYNKMTDRGRAFVNLFGSLFLLMPMFGYILWGSWDYVASSWALMEGSVEVGGLPYVYVLKTAIIAMAATMLLQGISQAIRNLLFLLGELPPERNAADEVG